MKQSATETLTLPNAASPEAEEARLRVSFPAGNVSHSYTVRYLPPTNFDQLQAEQIVRPGQPQEFSIVDDGGELRGILQIRAFGSTKATAFLRELDLDDVQPGVFLYTIPTTLAPEVPRTYAGAAFATRTDASTVRVGWPGSHDFPADEYIVSVASNEEDLFSESARTVRIPSIDRRMTDIRFSGSGFAGVRLGTKNKVLEENETTVSFGDAPDGTGTVASLSISGEETVGRDGEDLAISADIDGDAGIEWLVVPEDAGTVADPAAPNTTLTVGSKPGDLILRSTSDPTTEPAVQAIRPDVVSGAALEQRIENVGDGTSVRVVWEPLSDDPDDQQITYRVYWNVGESVDDLEQANQVQTARTQLTLTDLPEDKEIYVRIAAEDRVGNRMVSNQELLTTTRKVATRPAVLRLAALRSYEIAPGASITVDLIGRYFPVFDGPPETALSQALQELEMDVRAIGGDVDVTKTPTGVVLSAAPDALIGPHQTIVLVRFAREGFAPVWASFCASVGEESKETAHNWGGAHISGLSRQMRQVELTDFAGENWSVERQKTFDGELRRHTHELSLERLDSAAELDVADDDEPGIVVIKGEKGWSTAIIGCDEVGDPVPPPLPILSQDIIRTIIFRVEDASGGQEPVWKEFDEGEVFTVTDDLFELDWLRVLAGPEGQVGARLYDIDRTHLPREVHYGPPTFYGGRWFDYDEFPEDVRSTLQVDDVGQQYAVYRSGLKGPSAEPTPPVIEGLRATQTSTSVSLSWKMFNPLDPDQELTDIPVPLTIQQKNASAQKTGQTGYGRAEIDGLIPNTLYEVRLGDFPDQTLEFRTKRHLPDLSVTGQIIDENTYRYVYTVTQHPDTDEPYIYWVDPFGERHFTAQVTITAEGQPITEHELVIGYQGEEVRLSTTAEWKAPSGPVEFVRSVQVGQRRPARKGEPPVFSRLRYSGTRTKDLEHNVYEPGTHRTKILGLLPPTIPGHLEDYCEAVFVSPNGEELGAVVTLEVPTELAVRLRVSAVNGETPQVTGVRIVYDRS